MQRVVGEKKSVLAVVIPGERIDGHHTRRSAAFALKRKKSVPCSDVEDGFPRQVGWNLQEFQAPRKAAPDVPLRTGLDAIQLERMAPLQRFDLLLQRLGGH